MRWCISCNLPHWSGMGSPSLLSSINLSFIIHHPSNQTISLFRISTGIDSHSLVSFISSFFTHHLVWVVLCSTHASTLVSYIIWFWYVHLSHPSTVVLYLIWFGWFFIGLIHQQLIRSSSSWIPSFLSSINSCSAHILVRIVLHWSHPSTVVYSSSDMDFFICLIHQLLFCSSSGMDSLSLVSPINRFFVHHLAWITSSFSSINSCFVHHLVWVVLYWCHPSTVVWYIIWYGFLHMPHPSTIVFAQLLWPHPSTVASCMIWYGFLQLCQTQTVVFTSRGMGSPSLDSFITIVIWLRIGHLSHPSTVLFHISGMGSPSLISAINSCFVHHLVWIPTTVSDASSCFYITWYG